MTPVRRAVIDVGTNSVKVLVADVAGRNVTPLLEQSRQTRLGKGFYPARRLQPGAIEKTAEAVAGFAAKARELKTEAIRVIATSATREALNATELLQAIEQATGLQVEIISGDREAEMAFEGVTTDPALARGALLLLDVGGGSTQLILGHAAHKDFASSFPLGTVRLLERMPPGDPPKIEELSACRTWVRDFLESEVQPRLEPELRRLQSRTPKLVGSGGTASILGCMEAELDTFGRARLEATRLSRARLEWHVQRLWSLPLLERKQIVGLPANRADVILTGAVIYATILEHFGFSELRVSTRGMRFAAVLG